jgi:excisionase family DNA binding protein
MPAGRKPPTYAPVDPPPAEPDPRELWADGALTLTQAARFTGQSRRTLAQLIAAGELPFSQPGKCVLLPRRVLVDRLAKHAKRRPRTERRS